jgi:hemoglobin
MQWVNAMSEPGTRLFRTGRLVPEGLDETLIAAVVDDFYVKARTDRLLGPIFTRVIPDEAWQAHMRVIANFWSSILLGTGHYGGMPMPKHLAIAELSDEHFRRWLELFRGTVEALCPPPIAALFVDRAERIAHSFRLGLAYQRGEDTSSVRPMPAPETAP